MKRERIQSHFLVGLCASVLLASTSFPIGQSNIKRRPLTLPDTPTFGTVRFTTFSEAATVLRTLAALLPEELVHAVAAGDSSEFDQYVRRKDAQVRERLRGGDLDTLANLLLFGSSYTTAAVLTPELLKSIHATSVEGAANDPGSQALLLRLDQLALALAHPGKNERLEYFHDLLLSQHYQFETPQEIFRVKQFLGANLMRMLHEDASYAEALAEAQRMQSAGFEKRSQVFAQRGISLDTSLFPSFALEEALGQAKRKGLLRSPILRVAVIGPGLDVINKDEGWDFYPEQTIQPFLLADTLVRLGLSQARALEIKTFDISDLVNHHLFNARARAARGIGYTVQLPLRSDIPWEAAAKDYWKSAGAAIGAPAIALKSRRSISLEYKAITFPASQVLRIHPVNLNAIYQREDIPESGKLDLIVATNIFVYYDTFEQALALNNVASMLREGGLLLTNDAMTDVAGLDIHRVDFSETAYSSRPNDGDRITFYQRSRPR